MSSVAVEPGDAAASKVKLLLVDDQPPNLVDLGAILELPTYELVTVGSMTDAMRAAQTNEFALILVSAEMPLIAEQLEALAHHATVVMVTSHVVNSTSAAKAYEIGAVDLLHRSLDARILRARVAMFVELYLARARVQHLSATLLRADRLQQQFLATLGQELRAPLNTIIGRIRMLRDGTLREAQRGRALEIVENTAVAQLEMIQEMIDISRMTSGTLTLELGPVDLGNIVQVAIEAVRPTALDKQVTLHAAIDADIAPMSGDRERLTQVVDRLVSNALECTPTEGLVTVSLRNVGSQVELAITDTGAGVEPALLPRLFDRFVSDLVKTRAGGALGLALVRHLVDLHGGTITAHSAGPRPGCSFVVNLPAEGRMPRTDDEVR